ncbi:MAG: hypothetical protein HZB95_04890 [Nitrosomonadales bacterium]|nr:hypothetical protein [Nitrosomonadales bacterium]
MERKVNAVSLALVGAMLITVPACTRAPVAVPPTAQTSHDLADRQARVPDEYLVTLAPDVGESVITERYGRFGIRELNALGGETFLLILQNDPGPGEMADLVREDARFVAVQPNLIYWANRSGKQAK